MKGKKGDAAARRHTIQELESRAERAERAEERLTAEVAELRTKIQRQQEANRRHVMELTEQRDQASSPELDAALRRNADLIRERDEGTKRISKLRDSYRKAHLIALRLLMDKGYTGAEADAAIVAATKAGLADAGMPETDPISKKTVRKHGHEALDAIARARGFREAPTERAEPLATELATYIEDVKEAG